jgi:hypothetical protein
VDDLLRQLKLSSSPEEKKNSYLTCVHYVEKEVLPMDFGKNLVFTTLSSKGVIISSRNDFIRTVMIWIGRLKHEEDRFIFFLFELIQLHHTTLSRTNPPLSKNDDSDLVNGYALVDFFYRLAVAESLLRWKQRDTPSSTSTSHSFRRLSPSHFLVQSLLNVRNDSKMHSHVPDGYVSMKMFQVWSKTYCPNILQSFHQLMNLVIFPSTDDTTAQSLLYFESTNTDSSFFHSSLCPNLFALSISSPFTPLFQGVRA